MTKVELFYFLGKCLSLGKNEGNREKITRAIKNDEVNWDHFVELASGHLVLPSVYLRFKEQGILSFLPQELVSHLQMVYDLNLKRNTAILGQIDKINRLFATSGIGPIYLKGAANILDLYEDLGERMLGDIDLLVSDDEFLPAVKLLKNEGYEHNYPFFDEEQAVTKHFPRLVHPTELADVEVHRVPVELQLSALFNYSVINPEKKQVETHPPCFVLSDRHKVILNFMHGFMNRDVRMSRNITFRNLVDLLFLSKRVDVHGVFESLPRDAKQARVYADFMYHSLGIDNPRGLAPQSQKFILKYGPLHQSRFRYRVNWTIKYFGSRIWSGYLCNAAGVLFDRKIRRTVFRKLGDPDWYRLHLKSYRDSFRQGFR
ncbi:MAG: nucleotidyltransferase family protein [Prolixibacteraceae bacterium]|jgi:hypothetical protein|nr:nucleotidyltransferase family protein [Prolixibacteraceae bacterium]